MSAALKPPQVVIHELLQEYSVNDDELKECLHSFLSGDCGVFNDEDEVLGFLEKDIKGMFRHGVYETESAGRIHVTGDHNGLVVLPDIVFAYIDYKSSCSINTCNCSESCHQNTTK
jgi:hypothetical protein